MTKLEIINETAAFYNKTNRGIDGNGCIYLNLETKNMCAVGRCMTETAMECYHRYSGSASSLGMTACDHAGEKVNYNLLTSLDLDYVLKDEYKGHSTGFWNSVQSFHDCTANWNENGLTERGRDAFETLKYQYKDQ